jgi:hypothetical protein
MDNTRKELLSKLSKAKNQAERDLIMLTSLPKEQKASARIFIEALAKASYPGVTFKR